MTLEQSLQIINKYFDYINIENYDGLIVKKLASTNTFDSNNSGQTHIAITGSQMDMFPCVYSNGYMECDVDGDDELKKYLTLQVNINIFKTNHDALLENNENTIYFGGHSSKKIPMTVWGAKRAGKQKADGTIGKPGIQQQLCLVEKDLDFVRFRKGLHENDIIIFLKKKNEFEYDCLGLRNPGDGSVDDILSLNGKFIKIPETTVFNLDCKSVNLSYMVGLAPEHFSSEFIRVFSFYGVFTEELIENLQKAEWCYEHAKTGSREYAVLKEIDPNATYDQILASCKDPKNSRQQRFAPETYDLCGKKYVATNNWYRNDARGNEIDFVKFMCTKLKEIGIEAYIDFERELGGENLLLYGVPGCGKSRYIEDNYPCDENNKERVVFYPDYSYSDFVGQILPRVDKKTKQIHYEFTPGPFTRILKKAIRNPGQKFYLVIEELNRGNAASIFGELFQLLDRAQGGESEYAVTNYDISQEIYGDEDKKIRIPSNLWILATMNTSDQNVFSLDTAFQRRWKMKQIPNKFKDDHEFANTKILDTSVTWKDFNEAVNKKIIQQNPMASTEDKRIGTYFIKADDLSVDSREFPEKVIKYLWDDAVKFSRDLIFRDKDYPSLELVIETFATSTADERLKVFAEGLFKNHENKDK